MAERVLVVGANWLGDCVMAMPALQAWRRAHPADRLCVLARRNLVPLWRVHPPVDEVIEYAATNAGTFAAARRLRAAAYDVACVLPNSFRTALIARLGGVPVRVGAPGHWRGFLLSRTVDTAPSGGRRHQAWEAYRLLGVEPAGETPEAPVLRVPAEAVERAAALLDAAGGAALAAVVPGAARGPSKRWPAGRFAEVGRGLAEQAGARVVVAGAPGEESVCAAVCEAIGPAAIDLCGQTSIPELVAAFARCRVVVANDSGGLHLAAAAGARVVGIYGLTDPARTGPLAVASRVISAAGAARSRDIPRESAESADALRGIAAADVLSAALDLWRRP